MTIEQSHELSVFRQDIEFRLSLDGPGNFAIYFRKPAWAKTMRFEGGNAVFENGFYKIQKDWQTGDQNSSPV